MKISKSVFMILGLSFLLFSCTQELDQSIKFLPISSSSSPETASLTIELEESSRSVLTSSISQAVITISSSDMTTITQSVSDLEDGSGSVTIDDVPIGNNRVITVQAYSKSAKLNGMCLSAVTDISSTNSISIDWYSTALGNVYLSLLDLGVDIANLTSAQETALANSVPENTNGLLVYSSAIASDFYNSNNYSTSALSSASSYLLTTGEISFSYYGADGYKAVLNEPLSLAKTSCSAGETITISGAAPGTWILYLMDSSEKILSTTSVTVTSDSTNAIGVLPYDGVMVVVDANTYSAYNYIYYWEKSGVSCENATYPGETMNTIGNYYVSAYSGATSLSCLISTADSVKLTEDIVIEEQGVYLISSDGASKIGEGTSSTTSGGNVDNYDESEYSNVIYLSLGETSSWGLTESGTFYDISTSKTTIGDNIKIQYTCDDDGNNTGLIELNAKKSTAGTSIHLSGTLSTGGVKIQTNASDNILLYLDGVTMTSSNYPCIDITKGSKAYVILSGTNTLTDGRSYGVGYGEEYSTSSSDTYEDDDGNTVSCTVVKSAVYEGSDHGGTLYCKGDFVFSGSGSLSITESYKHCICSKGFIQVNGGSYTLISNSKNGFDARYGFTQNGGSINFTGNGDINVSTSSSSTNYYVKKANGISVDGIISSTNNGWIKMCDGTFTANITYGKGLKAKWDADEDTEDDGTSGTPDPSIYISGGTISITTSGTGYTGDNTSGKSYYYYDANGVSCYENIKCAAEGIESNSNITISGGNTEVTAADDALNASLTGGDIYISGGYLYAYAEGGDGLDSNGNISITGGTIVSLAPTGSEDALDAGDGYSVSITGGLIAAASGNSNSSISGGSNSLAVNYTGSSSGSSQGGPSFGGSSSNSSASIAGNTFVITNSSGSNLYTFTCPSVSSSSSSSGMNMGSSSGFGILSMASPNFVDQGTCTLSIYSSPTLSGGEEFNGLYTSLPSVSGSASSTTSVTPQ